MIEEDEEGGEEEEKDEDIREPCLPRKKEDDEKVAAGELNTEASPGGRVKHPATLLEKRGTTSKRLNSIVEELEAKF
ncbi:hypothetical protein NDU88_003433 [Pleurodeles waltl]|uniref:Uncharacterized protein n=1 Tax=Pleurodeles waltl TaxID=8319 RepID=A0AAV7NJC7_PLEWA|nr:hypothetical protein NDU88_003433 [Pleurodeles waltl]